MNKEPITVQIILFSLLRHDWQWTTTDKDGMVAIKRNGFVWFLNPFEFDIGDLLRMLEAEAYYRGREDQKIEQGLGLK